MKNSIKEMIASKNEEFIIASTTNNDLYLWNIKERKFIKKISIPYSFGTKRLAISNSGEYIVGALYEEGISLYSVEKEGKIWEVKIPGIKYVEFLNYKNSIIITTNEGKMFYLDLKTGNIIRESMGEKIFDFNSKTMLIGVDDYCIAYKNILKDTYGAPYIDGIITPLGIAVSQMGDSLTFFENNGKEKWKINYKKGEHIIKLKFIVELNAVAGIYYNYSGEAQMPYKVSLYSISNGSLILEKKLENAYRPIFIKNEIISCTGIIFNLDNSNIISIQDTVPELNWNYEED